LESKIYYSVIVLQTVSLAQDLLVQLSIWKFISATASVLCSLLTSEVTQLK